MPEIEVSQFIHGKVLVKMVIKLMVIILQLTQIVILLILLHLTLLFLPSMIRVCPWIMIVLLRQHRWAWRVFQWLFLLLLHLQTNLRYRILQGI